MARLHSVAQLEGGRLEVGVGGGICLERAGEPSQPCSLERINEELAPIGAGIWAQDWSGLSDDLKRFIADPRRRQNASQK